MTGLSDELNRLNTEGWSNRDIERIAKRHGHNLHNSTVSNYLAGRHATPTDRVLAAFAAVFGVDVNSLRTAAGMPGVDSPFDLGADGARLTGPQREAVRTVVRLYVEQNDALADRPVADGATTPRRRLSAVPGTLSHAEREELYRDVDKIDLDAEPYAAARPEDTSDDGEPL